MYISYLKNVQHVWEKCFMCAVKMYIGWEKNIYVLEKIKTDNKRQRNKTGRMLRKRQRKSKYNEEQKVEKTKKSKENFWRNW